jgi:histidinol-phosphatase (PHP family)
MNSIVCWPPDYHLHTPLCQHASGTPSQYAARAAMLGLGEIGFSDHSPMAQDGFDNWRMNLDRLDEYVSLVHEARRDYPQLLIRLALEVDYLPGHEAWIRDLAARYPWDYFIGSVHYISDSWAIDDPASLSSWRNRDPFDVWSVYFERLTQAAASGLFEIIGHADLPKKFGIRPDRDCTPLFHRFLAAARTTQTAIELNTAGLRKDCREIYPAPALLAIARELQIPITFGSDAHAPEEVGLGFREAVELARRAGYTHSCRFDRRRRQLVPLPAGITPSGSTNGM